MTENSQRKQNPFAWPGLVASVIGVAIIVLLGIGMVIVSMRHDTPTAATPVPTATAPTAPAPSALPKETSAEDSVCELKGEVLEGKLSEAPLAEWEYQDTTAYPTSAKFGPGKTNSDGVRYFFQHSPEGAVFAAANAVVQGTDTGRAGGWLNYFLADGPHREVVLSQGPGPGGSSQGARIEIKGFRLLAYDGNTARVDIAVRGTSHGQTLNLSMVYPLVWQGGDWKLSVGNPKTPINVAQIPDLSGYVPWQPDSPWVLFRHWVANTGAVLLA